MDDESITMQDIFVFERRAIDETGKVREPSVPPESAPCSPIAWPPTVRDCVPRCLNRRPSFRILFDKVWEKHSLCQC